MDYMSREDYCEEYCGIKNREGYKTCHNCAMLNVPSVDVQPVKHGYWKEEEPRVLKCTVCGEYAPMNYLGQNCIDSKYCPWCGARMDAEPDEPWQSD